MKFCGMLAHVSMRRCSSRWYRGLVSGKGKGKGKGKCKGKGKGKGLDA